MKNKFTHLLLGLVTFGACMHAATLTHRYAFDGNADDLIGDLDGILTTANDNDKTEAPAFGDDDLPEGAITDVAKKYIQLGITVGTKVSAINFGAHAETRIFDGAAGSFSYWFMADAPSQAGRELLSNVVGDTGLRTRLQGDGHIRLTGAGLDNQTVHFETNSAAIAETWHHLVVAWDDPNGELKIALDGSTQTQTFAAGALTNPSRLIAGNFNNNGNKEQLLDAQFDGKLFDLQMYQGMLSDADITSLYNNPGSSLSDLSIPELRHYSLLISLLVLGHMQARRRRTAN